MTQSAHPPTPESLLEHREWLRAIARHLVDGESAVDDVEQRAWLTVLRNRRPVASARGWLRTVVRTAASDERRADARRQAREQSSARPEALPPTDHLAMQLEAQRAVSQAVAGLPEPYRTTVLLRYIEELPVQEVARRMDVPAATARTRLHRALALLRDALDREFGDRRAWCLVLLPLGRTRPPWTGAALTTGALLMGAKGKAIAAVAVVLLAAAVLWPQAPQRVAPQRETAAAAPEAPPPPAKEPPARVRAVEAPSAPVAEGPAPAPPPAGPTIAGRVVDADGKPVAGARVVTHPDDLGEPVDLAKAGAKDSRSSVATADADGRFEAGADPKAVQLVVTVTADAGFGQAEARPWDRDVQVKLVPWTSLAGRVTNVAKEPVPGARVVMHLLLDALVEDRSATTDENGEYRIDRVPRVGWEPGAIAGRGRHAWVVVEAEGYAPLLVERDDQQRRSGSANLDLVLLRGVTLNGKVIDGDSKEPVAGATVVCWSVEGMMSFGSHSGVSLRNPWGPRPLGETTTASDGTFRFEHLPAKGPNGVASHNLGKKGQTLGHVAAWKEGYVHGGDEIPVLKEGAVAETTFELWPAATVTGRVVDESGQPIEGAWVAVIVEARSPALNGFPDFYEESRKAWVRTAADGTYRLPSFRASRSGPTTGRLVGGARLGRDSFQADAFDVTATAGETVVAPDLVVRFGATPRATIVVTDGEARPVAGATVEQSERYQTVRTGLDGRLEWSLGFVPSKADAPVPAQSVVVRARGFASQQVDFTPARGAPADVPVVLRPGGQVSGRVRMSDGRPAGRATVLVADGTRSAADAFEGVGTSWIPQRRADGRFVLYVTVTAADDGSFVAPDLPDGPYHVAAQMPSRAPTGSNQPPRMLRDVRSGVASGATDVVLTIPPDDGPPAQALDLVVTDPSGAAVENCRAQAVFGGVQFYAHSTEPTRLRFDALPPGRGVVEVVAPGWAKTTLADVVVGTDALAPVVIRLDRGVTLRGVLRAESGVLPEGTLLISPVEQAPTGDVLPGELRKDGTMEVRGLRPGRWRLVVVATADASGATAFVPAGDGIVTVPAGRSEAAVDLDVVRAGRVAMSTTDRRLPPFGGSLDPEKTKFGAESRYEVVDGAGAIVHVQTPVSADFSPTAWLAPGDYVVRLCRPGEAPQEERCTVRAGDTASARFRAR